MIKKYIIAAFLTGLLLPVTVRAEENAAVFNATILDISAQAESKAVPDIATVSADITTSSSLAADAMQENARRMTDIFKALKTAGIAEKDIQTSGININPDYVYTDNKPPHISSYQVTDSIKVTLRDIKNIGSVLDALIAQGANQLNGPVFSIENEDAVLDQARKTALEKAQKRAKLYADTIGMKIKRIVSMSEQSGDFSPPPYPRPMMGRAMAISSMAPPATPVPPGQLTLGITVNVRYELTP